MPKIKVSAGFSGAISVGSYENQRPSFFAEVEYDVVDGEDVEEFIRADQKKLHDIAYKNFKMVAEKSKLEKIKADFKNFRFYKVGEDREFVSVTSILGVNFVAHVDEDAMKVAISKGNISDARAKHYIDTGTWEDPTNLDGVGYDLVVLKEHGEVFDEWDFPTFLKKYPLLDLKVGKIFINEEHEYAGTSDAECMYPLDGTGEPVHTLIDFKRTPQKISHFPQTAAYSKCDPKFKQMMLISANPDNKQNYSKPIITSQIDKYFEVFLHKRKEFRKFYGI